MYATAEVQKMWQIKGIRADGGKLGFPVMAFDIAEASRIAKKKAKGGRIYQISLVVSPREALKQQNIARQLFEKYGGKFPTIRISSK